MRGIFWSYLFWGTANWHLNWQHSIIWTALGTRAINELTRLLKCKWKMKLPKTLLKNCADTSITGWKMAVPNVTLECHPHVCCSQQGETVWMMEKYASTYRQEMGWCLRIFVFKYHSVQQGNWVKKWNWEKAWQTTAESAWDIPYLNRKVFLFRYQIFKSYLFCH